MIKATFRAAALASIPLAFMLVNFAVAAPVAAPEPSFADLADLADSAQMVVRAEVRGLTRIKNEAAPGLQPGWGRFFVKARTRSLLTGGAAIGESLRYLVDLPLDAKGKPPALKKRIMLLFANPVAGRPDQLQLVAPDGQIVWSESVEARLRPILIALASPDAPPVISAVRELIHVPGTLSGEGETQIFLSAADGSAVSIAVRRQADMAPAWGVSFSELMAETGNRPARDSLAWYRLACFLPARAPVTANLSETEAARAQASADYRLVMAELGPCPRTRL